MDRSETDLNDPSAKFVAIGLGLLYLGIVLMSISRSLLANPELLVNFRQGRSGRCDA